MLQKLHITITAILSVVVIVLSFLLQNSCNRANTSAKDFDTLLKIHTRDSSELVDKTNKLGQITVTAQAYELSQKDLAKYVAENSDIKNRLSNAYKKINSLNITISNFHIDTLRIPVSVHDTIPCGDIDKDFPVSDKYYSFDFKFKNKIGHSPEFYFLNFNIPDTATDIIGVKKSGFLNMKHELVSEQSHSNKYIKIEGVKTIVKSEAKPKTLKKIVYGIAIGLLSGYLLFH